jgi:hypothetical protein
MALPWYKGRFLGILRKISREKMPKNRMEKTAQRFFYFYKANFDLLPYRTCNKIVKIKLLVWVRSNTPVCPGRLGLPGEGRYGGQGGGFGCRAVPSFHAKGCRLWNCPYP